MTFLHISLDTVQITCWSLAYLFIIVNRIKHRYAAMPMDALILNSSWELTALIFGICKNDVFIGHIVWFGLDAVILYFSYRNLPGKKILIFGAVHIACTAALCILFKHGFMLQSVFIIDLLMAVSYLQFVIRKRMRPGLLPFLICLCEFAGDLAAFLYYKPVSSVVLYTGSAVQVLHVIRFIMLLFLPSGSNKRKHTGGKHRRK